jgi:hypothetical protein
MAVRLTTTYKHQQHTNINNQPAKLVSKPSEISKQRTGLRLTAFDPFVKGGHGDPHSSWVSG